MRSEFWMYGRFKVGVSVHGLSTDIEGQGKLDRRFQGLMCANKLVLVCDASPDESLSSSHRSPCGDVIVGITKDRLAFGQSRADLRFLFVAMAGGDMPDLGAALGGRENRP